MIGHEIWCTLCEKDTHNDSQCWGLGTQAVVIHTPFPAHAKVRLISMHVRFITESWTQEQSC